ncbi:MAG TPA: EAL domain-containing protein [Acidimicrobiales bacterium]|nr:EAL domain-containing protein [Acidimicrobiales bacterium]
MVGTVRSEGRRSTQRLVRERFIWRFRLAAVCFATVQTLIEPGDGLVLSWANIALFWLSVGVSGRMLQAPTDDRTVRRVGAGVMAADVVVVVAILCNNLTDPAEPIYLIAILAQLEATMRWPRRGGVVAGVAAGLAAGAWTVAVTARTSDVVELSYASMRAGTIIALGVFLGRLVRRLSDQTEILQGVLDTSMDLIIVLDAEGTITSVNAASLPVLGRTPEEMVGTRYDEYLHEDNRPRDARRWLAQLAEHPVLFERRVLRADGSWCWLELNVAPALAAGAVHIAARDVTDRREAARRIAESEQRFRSLFEHNTDAIYALDLEGRFTSVNPAAERITGYAVADFLDMAFAPLIHPDHVDRTAEHFRRAASGDSQDYETVLIARDGRHIDLHVTNTPIVVDGEIVGVFGVAKDVTERRRLERQLGHQATHDALTGLPNRSFLELALDAATAEQHVERTLLFIDLDRFKLVNDSLGHRSGDEVLVSAVERLRQHVRGDDLLARWAGDEFCVLLAPGTQEDQALHIADRLRAVLAEPFAVAGREVRLSASIGVARSDGGTGERLVQIADHAMYEAKRSGRDRVAVYDGGAATTGPTQIDQEAELRRAIDERALVVHHQPIVEISTGRIVALESLVRWPQPDGSVRLPASFVPLAEEAGLVRALTRFVLDEVCQQLVDWDRELGTVDHLQIWANVSVTDLEDPCFADEVAAVLDRHALSSTRLVLEVTETMLMRDADQVDRTVEDLRAIGVSMAIDDFGTGYSSMSQLRQLDVTACKIDRGFVAAAPEREQDAAILRALIEMGVAFGFPVVAEGVERQEELALLEAMGCPLAQGYLFATPTAAHALTPLLRDGRVPLPGSALLP